MKKIFVILSLSVILLACNNKKNGSIVDSFKTKQMLAHKVFEVQNGANELLNPYAIAISGNTMTTHNLMTPDVFTTIDIATGRIIKHWGTRGQGPNEFSGRVDMNSNYSETGLNVWNITLSKLYFFSTSDLESGLINFQNIPVKIEDDIMDRYNSVIQLDTFLFFASGGNHDKLFALFDTKNSTVKEIGDFPPEDDENKDLLSIYRKMAYNGRLKYNNSLKKLVYVSIASEMFEIYNFNGSDVEFAMGNYSTVPKYGEVNVGNARTVVTDTETNGKGRNIGVTSSDENIFILYQDYRKMEIGKGSPSGSIADIILVFDWDGKPVKKYELDCIVKSINYDKARNRLWAIHDNPDPEVIYFEL